jgi:hypothetical protein
MVQKRRSRTCATDGSIVSGGPTNDLTVRGRVTFKEDLGGGRTRTFATNGAHYVGTTRTLTLDHTATITDSGATITVSSVSIDFRTGEAQLGRIVGVRPDPGR